MKTVKYILPIIGICTFGSNAYGQDQKDWRLYQPDTPKKDTLMLEAPKANIDREVNKPQSNTNAGSITFYQDEKIELLDSLRKEHPGKIDGYRLQIFFGNRNEARELRAKFLQEHPELGAYISYLAPNFRLRVGDFRTRLECEAFKKEIAQEFPGSYLVKDKIELPNLYPEKSEEETVD